VSTAEVVDAKKTKIDEAAAWQLLKDAGSIAIAKGKKVHSFTSAKTGKDEILKHAMGPSGNLRAPTYRTGDQFVIGFNAELYEDWLS
jgi:hypothetical protein